MSKTKQLQPLQPSIQADIKHSANYLMIALKRECKKETRDELTIAYLIASLRLLPVFIPELQEYL